MEIIYLIRGSIGKFIKSFDLVLKALLKILVYYLLFRYVSNMEGLVGSGVLNSTPAHLILAVVSMLLPNRCGVLMAILLGLFNMSQVTVLGAGVAAAFFLVLYLMTSRLFPDHVYMLILVPLILHYKLYLLLPLVAGMYLGVVALIPMICGAIMSIMLNLIPEFMKLQMPKNLDELPQILSDIFKYGFNQILHNEELVFVAIVFTGVVILVYLLRKMETNYGAYIALVAGTVLGLVCLFMGKMTFGITDAYGGIIGRSVLALVIMMIIEFMHSALDYQSTQKLSFEDDEYQYFVTVIPKISVSKPKREVKNITETVPKKQEEPAEKNRKPEHRSENAGKKRMPEKPVAESQNTIHYTTEAKSAPVRENPVRQHEIPGMPLDGIQIEKPATQKPAARDAAPVKRVEEKVMKPKAPEPAPTTRIPVVQETKKVEVKKPAQKEEPLASFFEED